MSTHISPEGTGEEPRMTSVDAYLDVRWGPRFWVLLETAKDLNDDGYPEAAIVTAHSACEIFTQLVFPRLLRAKGYAHLDEPIRKLLASVSRNYHIGHGEVRDLYVALSGDRIQHEPFWKAFKDGVDARNDVVHEGIEATKGEAADFIEAIEKVIGHMRLRFPPGKA